MGKRPASSSASVAAALKAKAAKVVKKAKQVDPIEQKCELVVASVRKLSCLPEEVAGLLGDVIPYSLALCKEERHAYQQGMVEAVQKELLRQEEALEKAVAEAFGRVDQLEKDREVQETSLAELDATLTKCKDQAHEKKFALADAARAFRAAKEGLAEAESRQAAGDKSIKEVDRKHEALGKVIAEVLEPLKEGTMDKEKVPEASSTLIATLQDYFEIEESLVPAIPTVLAKEPSARGPFDTMAAVQLEEQAKKALADLAAEAKGGEAAKAERAAAVAQAAETLSAARDAQRGIADTFAAARAEEEAAEAAVITAKLAIKAVGPERKVRAKAVIKAQDVLKEFREGPLAAFKELSDRSSQATEAPAEAEAEAETAEAVTVEVDAEMTAEPTAAADA